MEKKSRTRRHAIKRDTAFYAELDIPSGLWCVFGNQSGFAYASYADEYSAVEKASAMELNYKNISIRAWRSVRPWA